MDPDSGAILLRRRPPKGLLGGMTEVPGTDWSETFDPSGALSDAPFEASWQRTPADVSHTFTHFHLKLAVFRADLARAHSHGLEGTWWSAPEALDTEALPTVMRKVLKAALD